MLPRVRSQSTVWGSYSAPAAAPEAPQPPRGAGAGPRVLLLDEEWAATVHVAAALAAAGCTVHAFTPGKPDTRFLDGVLARIEAPPVDSAAYLPALARIVDSGRFDHVIGLTDPTLHALWSAPRSWEALDYPRTTPHQRAVLRNKRLQLECARSAGVRCPDYREVATVAGVADAVRSLGLPVVVKGVAGVGGQTVRIAESEAEAAAHWRAFPGEEPAFLQRYVHGATYLVGGLFADGAPLRVYAAEKTEMVPALTGPSVRLRTVDEPELVAAALAVFRELRWSGIASADFVRGADGRFYFLEVNPRPWGSVAAVAAAGVDLFGPLAALLAGGDPAPQLAWRAGVDRALFPQYMQARAAGGTLPALARALCDPAAWRAAPWHRPALLLHLARWPWRDWVEARRARAAAARTPPHPAPSPAPRPPRSSRRARASAGGASSRRSARS